MGGIMQVLINKCRKCGHKIPDGEEFCDSLCQEEYESYICVMCGELAPEGHTIRTCEAHPEWVGRRIHKECWNDIGE